AVWAACRRSVAYARHGRLPSRGRARAVSPSWNAHLEDEEPDRIGPEGAQAVLAAGRIAHQIAGADRDLLTVAIHPRAAGEHEVKLFLVGRMPVATNRRARRHDREVDGVTPAGQAGPVGDAADFDSFVA